MQTLKTKKQTYSQFCLIKNCIFIHQRNFFILILEAVDQLAKNVQIMVHEFTIICNEMCIFKTQIQHSRNVGKLKNIFTKKIHLIERIL